MKHLAYSGLAAGLFASGGWIIAALSESGVLPNHTVAAQYSANLAGVASRAGVALGVLTLLVAVAVWAFQKAIVRTRDGERAKQNNARNRLFQRLDHELKNPLTIILLGINNLQQSEIFAPVQTESLDRIATQARRLQQLVANLRLLSDLQSSRIERKSVQLEDLLEEIVSSSVACAGQERRVTLHLQNTPWPVSAVRGDHDLLALAFRNLVDNALKFSRPGDRVEVRAMEDGGMAVVEVADTGIGIPAEEISLIFEELYRGKNARGLPGSGLGLRLVQQIVLLHEGDIRVRSKPNQGTVFAVRLPLAPDAAGV